MCLDRIISLISSIDNSELVGVGYKFFVKDKNSHLYSFFKKLHQRCKRIGRYRINCWITDKNEDYICCSINNNVRYLAGFHLCKTLADCKKFVEAYYNSDSCVIRRVEYRQVVTEGYQDGIKVIVARQIRILPLKEKKVKTKKCV